MDKESIVRLKEWFGGARIFEFKAIPGAIDIYLDDGTFLYISDNQISLESRDEIFIHIWFDDNK